jgi:hypothetical protein
MSNPSILLEAYTSITRVVDPHQLDAEPDAHPDSSHDSDSDPDSDFYFMRIRIPLFTRMRILIRIQILSSK